MLCGGDREAEPHEATREKGCEPTCVVLWGFSPRRIRPRRAAGQILPCSQCACSARCLGQQVAGGAVLLPVLDLACPVGGAAAQGCARFAEPRGTRSIPGSTHQAAVRLREGAAGAAGPLPCAVPLIPAARAPLGRLHAAHPAARFVGGEGLQHVQAVHLRPPAGEQEGGGCSRGRSSKQHAATAPAPAPWDPGVNRHRAGPHLRAWSFSSSSVGLKACFTWCLAMASHLPMFFLRIWSQMTGTWWERQSGRWQPEQAGTGGQLAWGTGSRGSAGCACGYTGNRATCPTRQQALGEIGKTQLPGRAHHPHAVPTRAVAAARTQCSAAIRLSRFFHPSLPQIRTAREGLVAVKGKAPAKSSAWRGGCCFKQH